MSSSPNGWTFNNVICIFCYLQGIRTLDPELSTSLMGTAIMVTLSFAVSYIGSKITIKIAEVGEVAYNAQWRRYPKPLQKYIVLIVHHSQQTIHFHGYRVILCNLDVFMRVKLWSMDWISLWTNILFVAAHQVSLLLLCDGTQGFANLNPYIREQLHTKKIDQLNRSTMESSQLNNWKSGSALSQNKHDQNKNAISVGCKQNHPESECVV